MILKNATLVIISNNDDLNKSFFKNLNFLYGCYGKIYILNLKNIISRKFNKFKNKNYLSKNYNYHEVKNFIEFENFLRKKKFIALNILDRSISFHKIYRTLKKNNVKQILISDTGYIPGNEFIIKEKFVISFINYLKKRIGYIFFRLFVIFGFYPAIDLYLEASKTTIDKINNGISKKLDNFLKCNLFSYYKKIKHINCRYFNKNFKNSINNQKIISFLETPLNHPDRILKEGPISNEYKKKYYRYLINFLEQIEKIFKKKIVICAHPFSDLNEIKKIFKNFKVEQNKTENNVSKSEIVIFHQTSSIIQAIYQKKKIINLESYLMGNFLNYRNKLYQKHLKLLLINLSENYSLDKIKINKILVKNIKSYDNFIKKNIVNNKKFTHNELICKEIINFHGKK